VPSGKVLPLAWTWSPFVNCFASAMAPGSKLQVASDSFSFWRSVTVLAETSITSPTLSQVWTLFLSTIWGLAFRGNIKHVKRAMPHSLFMGLSHRLGITHELVRTPVDNALVLRPFSEQTAAHRAATTILPRLR